MLKVEDLVKVYDDKGITAKALDRVAFELADKGFVSIIGESGSGKSTLLGILGGLIRATSGEVIFNDEKYSQMDFKKWDEFRRKDMGYVFQDYGIIEDLSVEENVALPLHNFDISENEINDRVLEAIKDVGLEDKKAKKCSLLSGGEKQRTSIARAIVRRSRLILADEPTGNLDYKNSKNVFDCLKKLSKNNLVIVVTHDREMAQIYSDRIIELEDGKIVSDIMVSNIPNITLETPNEVLHIDTLKKLWNNLVIMYSKGINDCKIHMHAREKIEDEYVDEGTDFAEFKKINHSVISLIRKKVLRKRKLRSVLSSIIFFIAFFLVFIACHFLEYNGNSVIAEYLSDYDYVKIVKSLDTVYNTGDISNQITKGKLVYDELIEYFGDEKYIGKSFDSISVSCHGNEVDIDDGKVNWENAIVSAITTEGINDDEVVITDYVADQIEIGKDNIGDSIYIDGKKKIVSDIIDTDYELYIKSKNNNNINERLFDEMYNVIYVKNIINDDIESLYIDGNYFFTNTPYIYTGSGINVSSVNIFSGEITGDTPKEKNEIMVSYELAQQICDDNPNSIIGKNYSLINLYDKKYKQLYNGKMNLYDYLGEEVIVVGIFDGEYNKDVIVNDDIYNNIVSDYQQYWSFSNYIVEKNDLKWKEVLKILHSRSYKLQDQALDNIYSIVENKPQYGKFISFISCLIISLAIFLMINMYGNKIRDNGKLIAILKSMGYTNTIIRNMFIEDVFIEILEALAYAIITFNISILFLRKYTMKIFLNRVVYIVSSNMILDLLIVVSVLCIVLLIVSLSLKLFKKRSIMDLMKE